MTVTFESNQDVLEMLQDFVKQGNNSPVFLSKFFPIPEAGSLDLPYAVS